MAFDPDPGEIVRLLGDRLTILPLPNAPRLPFASEGMRATVYKVKTSLGRESALKVFLPKFRESALVDSAKLLSTVAHLDGLRAAQRQVALPADARSAGSPELAYAVLMPWIHGQTWFDVLLAHGDIRLSLDTASRLCHQFLKVVEALEKGGFAHCDLAAGNFVVDWSKTGVDVQLLDLEDMFLPGASVPAHGYVGSPGYTHAARASVWRAEGDRYAAAVLAAEMLIMSNPDLARDAKDSYFAGNSAEPIARKRYEAARPWLEQTAPAFTQCFDRAWFSRSLTECPLIAELRASVETLATTTVRPATPVMATAQAGFTFLPLDLNLPAIPRAPSTPPATPAGVSAKRRSSGSPFAPPPSKSMFEGAGPATPVHTSSVKPRARSFPGPTPWYSSSAARAAMVLAIGAVVFWVIAALSSR